MKNNGIVKMIDVLNFFLRNRLGKVIFLFVLFVCCSAGVYANVANAKSQHVEKLTKLLNDGEKMLGDKKLTAKQKRQKTIDMYMPYIDFKWNAKMALGRPFLQLNEKQKNEYLTEYTKFLAYTWLPKMNIQGEFKMDIKALDITERVGTAGTDELVTFIATGDDGTKYTIIIRSSIKDGKLMVRDVNVEGVGLASAYQAQFSSYIEQHGGNVASIIEYLKQQNEMHKANVDFVLPAIK